MAYSFTSNGSGPSFEAEKSLDPYKEKLKLMKKYAKEYVFINAAVCDQVAETQEKLLIAKEKRRFYFNKLQSIRAQFETTNQLQTKPNQLLTVAPQMLPSVVSEPISQLAQEEPSTVKPAKKRPKLKKPPVKPKKSTENLNVIENGKLIFPLRLGDLTIHSLGRQWPDKPAYWSEQEQVRVGFYSTRIYAHLDNPEKKCVYRCKVLPGDGKLRFQIVADVMDMPFEGETATDCHMQLVNHINDIMGMEVVKVLYPLGPRFFGFSHQKVVHYMTPEEDRLPILQNAVADQTFMVRMCNEDMFPLRTTSSKCYERDETSLSFDALQKSIMYAASYQTPDELEEDDEAEEMLGPIEQYGTWI